MEFSAFVEEDFFAGDDFTVDVSIDFEAGALDVGFDFGGFADVDEAVGEEVAEVFSDAADASVDNEGAVGFDHAFDFCACGDEDLVVDVSLCGEHAFFVGGEGE